MKIHEAEAGERRGVAGRGVEGKEKREGLRERRGEEKNSARFFSDLFFYSFFCLFETEFRSCYPGWSAMA